MARFAPGWFDGDALAGLFSFEDIALGVVARAVACTRARRCRHDIDILGRKKPFSKSVCVSGCLLENADARRRLGFFGNRRPRRDVRRATSRGRPARRPARRAVTMVRFARYDL
jgi:hypothetical protein